MKTRSQFVKGVEYYIRHNSKGTQVSTDPKFNNVLITLRNVVYNAIYKNWKLDDRKFILLVLFAISQNKNAPHTLFESPFGYNRIPDFFAEVIR
jgi:alpha-mannosidase